MRNPAHISLRMREVPLSHLAQRATRFLETPLVCGNCRFGTWPTTPHAMRGVELLRSNGLSLFNWPGSSVCAVQWNRRSHLSHCRRRLRGLGARGGPRHLYHRARATFCSGIWRSRRHVRWTLPSQVFGKRRLPMSTMPHGMWGLVRGSAVGSQACPHTIANAGSSEVAFCAVGDTFVCHFPARGKVPFLHVVH